MTDEPQNDDPTAVGSPEPVEELPAPVSDSPSAAYRRRQPPNPNRPVLPAEAERALVPINEASARMYDLQEEAGEKAMRFAQEIDDGAVRVIIEPTDSLVYALRPPRPAPKSPEEPKKDSAKDGPDGQE